MTRFTPMFFHSGTRVPQKQGTHSSLFEPIVHVGVTALAGFCAYIPLIFLFGLFVLLFCSLFLPFFFCLSMLLFCRLVIPLFCRRCL